MLTGALLLVATYTPLVPWVAAVLSREWTDSDGDILVVLAGSAVQFEGRPTEVVIGESSYWRAIHAARAFQQGHFRVVVVSGARASDPMKRFLMASGVPEKAIITQDRSNSTREDALYCKPILEKLVGKRVLLTSDYHSYRASRAFARAGIAVTPRPFSDVLKRSQIRSARWQGLWIITEELTKIAYYRARGWI